MDKIKTKAGFSLVAILFSMVFAMAAIVAATPVITARLTQINIGAKTATSVSLGQQRGSYICYRDGEGDNDLRFVRADIQPNGRIVTDHGRGCRFRIPRAAESYTITAIGGGSGGLATAARFDDDELDCALTAAQRNLNGDNTLEQVTMESVNFGENQTALWAPIPEWRTWITEARFTNALSTFVNAENLRLIVSSVSGRSQRSVVNGATGNVSMVKGEGAPTYCYTGIDRLIVDRNNIHYRSGTADSPTGMGHLEIRSTDDKSVLAMKDLIAGRGLVRVGDAFWNPNDCALNGRCAEDFLASAGTAPASGDWAFNAADRYLVASSIAYKTPADDTVVFDRVEEGPVAGFYSGACDPRYVAGQRVKSLNYQLFTPNIEALVGGVSGNPGSVETAVVPFLAYADDEFIDFGDRNVAYIGKGGHGGTVSVNPTLPFANIPGLAGQAGENTTITLKTGVEGAGELESHFIAQGGAAVNHVLPVRTFRVEEASGSIGRTFVPGNNGVSSSLQIPAELQIVDRLMRRDTVTPVSGGDCGTNCTPQSATYPGDGGASAGLSYQLDHANFILRLSLDNVGGRNFPSCSDAILPERGVFASNAGNGGDGAHGAIIVTW